MGDVKSKTYNPTEAERDTLMEFPEEFKTVGPKHEAWNDRIKDEIDKIMAYTKWLTDKQGSPWFRLRPRKLYNFRIWDGYIQIPSRPEIKFKIVVVLSKEYPKDFPKCYVHESILPYTEKLFPNMIWKDHNTNETYVLICHQHMEPGTSLYVNEIWKPTLSIAHYFVREVRFWWSDIQNNLIEQWDKLHRR
ncbi:MAG: hypothetical protein ACFFCD_18135 [Promethearchaeota archaeon]